MANNSIISKNSHVDTFKVYIKYFYKKDWIVPFILLLSIPCYLAFYFPSKTVIFDILSLNLTMSSIFLTLSLAAFSIIGLYANTSEQKKLILSIFQKEDFIFMIVFPITSIYVSYYTILFLNLEGFYPAGIPLMVILSCCMTFLSIWLVFYFSLKLINMIFTIQTSKISSWFSPFYKS